MSMKRQFLKTADHCGLLPLFSPFNKGGVVFMAHRFSNQRNENSDHISSDILEQYLKYLVSMNYKIIGVKEYIDGLITANTLNKIILFTIDDGYRDFYEYAFPLFKKYNLPATVFLTTDFVDQKRHLWWDIIKFAHKKNSIHLQNSLKNMCGFSYAPKRGDQLREVIEVLKKFPDAQKNNLIRRVGKELGIQTDGLFCEIDMPLSWGQIREMAEFGIEFYPHTKSHPILSMLERESVREEVESSKERVEAETKKQAPFFCYPNGHWNDFNQETISILKTAGVQASFTAEEGFNVPGPGKQDLFRLHRYSLPTEFLRFKQIVSGFEAFKFQVREKISNNID